MTVTEADLTEIQAIIAPLLGQKAWDVSLGVGSFITIEFGAPLSIEETAKIHGE